MEVFAITFISTERVEIFTGVAVVSFVILKTGIAFGSCLCEICFTCAQEKTSNEITMLKKIPFIITGGFAINEMAGAPELHKGKEKMFPLFKRTVNQIVKFYNNCYRIKRKLVLETKDRFRLRKELSFT